MMAVSMLILGMLMIAAGVVTVSGRDSERTAAGGLFLAIGGFALVYVALGFMGDA